MDHLEIDEIYETDCDVGRMTKRELLNKPIFSNKINSGSTDINLSNVELIETEECTVLNSGNIENGNEVPEVTSVENGNEVPEVQDLDTCFMNHDPVENATEINNEVLDTSIGKAFDVVFNDFIDPTLKQTILTNLNNNL